MLATLLVAGFLAVPAAVPTATAAEDDKVTFTVGLNNEADSFNPFSAIEVPSLEVLALAYDRLISYDMEDMSPQPGLATEWESSEDGLTWTFTLKDGAQFSDGEPLTADDVVHTFSRIIDGGYEANSYGSYLTSVEEVVAVDDTTVELRLEKPNAVLPLLPIPILPEHVWSEIDDNEVKTYENEPQGGEPIVGSGPFRFVEGTAGGSTYRLEANPDYWGGAPYVDEIVMRVYKNDDALSQALIKGEVDIAYNLNALQVDQLNEEDGITAHNGVSPGFSEIGFNAGAPDPETGEPFGDGNPALRDPKFRYALGFAVDREVIADRAFQGAAVPGDTLVPDAYGSFKWEPPEDVALSFDPERAEELLDEAGYEKGPDGLRTMPDGNPIGTLRLFARSESKSSLTTMEFFKEWLADIGIESEVSTVESNKLTSLILDGEYDAFEWGWYVEPDPDSMLSYLTCDQIGGWNDATWCNEEYDRLYQAQNASVDDEERVEQIKRMQEIFHNEAPYIITVYEAIGEAVRSDRWACLQPQPDPGGTWIVQYGVQSYLQVRPIDEAGDCDGVTTALNANVSSEEAAGDDSGSSTPLLIGGAVVLVVLLGGGALMAMRRRGTVSDRE